MAPERGGGAGRSLRGDGGGCRAPEGGLPEAFLQSLRPLFDILDDRRRGYIHLREIESRWRQQEQHTGAEAGQLPRGVLEGLRRAAPPSGYLTFERFVLGLRAALLSPEKGGGGGGGGSSPAECITTAKIPARSADAACGVGRRSGGGGSAVAPSRGREKLPGGSGGADQAQSKRAAADGSGVRRLVGQSENLVKVDGRRQPRGRGEQRRHTITNGVDYSMLKQMKELEKEKDFLLQGLEMVERIREWYQHQLLLLQERQKQLGMSKPHCDLLAEGNLPNANDLFPKLQDLNRCLCELLRLSAKVSTSLQPVNSSCAMANSPSCNVATSPPVARPEQTISMLKEQNRLLTKEVTDKSDRITQLEQEKSSLIKQLFEARAHGAREASQLDSTFI